MKKTLSALLVLLPAIAMAQEPVIVIPNSSMPAFQQQSEPGPVLPNASMPAFQNNPNNPAPSQWGSPWSGNSLMTPQPVPAPGMPPAPAPIYNTNQGYTTVMACGYDAMGVWRVLPLYVSYQYNGVQYNVTVINAWDPWTKVWNYGVEVPAVNTSYYLKGTTFNFYVVLSTGTFYFNL